MPDVELGSISGPMKALRYLRDRARTAHDDGDGLLVNHFCALGLEHIIKWLKASSSAIPQEELRWLLVFPLRWLTHDSFLSRVKELHRTLSAVSEAEEPSVAEQETAFLSVWKHCHDLLYQSMANPAPAIQALLEAPIGWTRPADYREDSSLLTLAVELLWARFPEEQHWRILAENWIERLGGTALTQALFVTKERLAFQTRVLFPSAEGATSEQGDSETAMMLGVHPSILKAWRSSMRCEWQELDIHIRQLVSKLDSDDPMALAITHLNSSSWHPRGAPCPTLASFTRRAIMIRSRRHSAFRQAREEQMERGLLTLWRERTTNHSNERFHCVRLATMVQIDSAAAWDLVSWCQGIGGRYEVYREFLRFPDIQGREAFALAAIRLGVLSTRFAPDDAMIRTAIELVDSTSAEDRAQLASQLMATPERIWKSASQAFSLLTDAIPQECHQELAHWSVRYMQCDAIMPNPSAGMAFWESILEYSEDAQEVCAILHPAVLNACKNWPNWRNETGLFLREYLKQAPPSAAIEVLDGMFAAGGQEDASTNRPRWSIAFSVFHHRPDLRNYLAPLLRDTAVEPELTLYLQHASSTDSEPQAIDDESHRKYIRESLRDFSEKIASRGARDGIGFGGYLSPNIIPLVVWRDEERELLEALQLAMKAPRVSLPEQYFMLHYLERLVSQGPISHSHIIRQAFENWLSILPAAESIFPVEGDPFSSFKAEGWYRREHVLSALMALAVTMAARDPEITGRILQEWLPRHIVSIPIDSLNSVLHLTSVLACNSADFRRSYWQSCMFTVLAQSLQVVHVPEKAHDIRDLAYTLANLLRGNGKDKAWLRESDSCSERQRLFDFLISFIDSWAHNGNADVRAAAAHVLTAWQTIDALPAEQQRILNALAEDARARVRFAAKGKWD